MACIARDNLQAASALVVEADDASTRLLARRPDIGRSGRVPGLRRFDRNRFAYQNQTR